MLVMLRVAGGGRGVVGRRGLWRGRRERRKGYSVATVQEERERDTWPVAGGREREPSRFSVDFP